VMLEQSNYENGLTCVYDVRYQNENEERYDPIQQACEEILLSRMCVQRDVIYPSQPGKYLWSEGQTFNQARMLMLSNKRIVGHAITC
jgi:hypothetical protein